MVHGKTFSVALPEGIPLSTTADPRFSSRASVLQRLRTREPLFWLCSDLRPSASVLARIEREYSIGLPDVEAADARLRRWSTALVKLFPELHGSAGLIESPLMRLSDPSLLECFGVKSQAF